MQRWERDALIVGFLFFIFENGVSHVINMCSINTALFFAFNFFVWCDIEVITEIQMRVFLGITMTWRKVVQFTTFYKYFLNRHNLAKTHDKLPKLNNFTYESKNEHTYHLLYKNYIPEGHQRDKKVHKNVKWTLWTIWETVQRIW